jgi:NADPH:quinone reductase-like Zn-dependent oxidoreductase
MKSQSWLLPEYALDLGVSAKFRCPLARFGGKKSYIGWIRGTPPIAMHQLKTPERFDPMKRYVYEHLANGSFKPRVDRTFPFEQAAEAYRYLESNQQVGKVVITL